MPNCSHCQTSFIGDSKFCCHSCELLYSWNQNGQLPKVSINSVSEKWQKYNFLEIEKSFNQSPCSLYKKFQFYIEGLQCSSCVHLLENFPLFCDEILFSKVNYSKHIFEVEAKSTISLGAICEAIEQLGYLPKPLSEVTDYEAAKQAEIRNDIRRLGIAGAIAGNTMLFSVPLYVGVDETMAIVFKWISFFVFLPLIFYVAVPFYKKAWSSLLVRRISIDMMIVVALLSGFIFSTYSLIKNSNDIYFDSTASFIFLILLTRFILKKHQDKLSHKNILSDLFETEVYKIISHSKEIHANYRQIQSNDLYQVKKNQLVPCDSILKSEQAEFDQSFLTGEAFPQIKFRGDRILAGSRLLNKTILCMSLEKASKSALAKSIDKVDIQLREKTSLQSLSDYMAHRLTLGVFTTAGIFFLIMYPQIGFDAFKRCLALITIACPCAIAFGAPLANSLGLKKAIKNGFFIRTEDVFEKLVDIKKIIFDKTGTLTFSQMDLIQTVPHDFFEEDKSIILGLENQSLHPVAMSLKNAWSNIKLKKIPQVIETAGFGVEGFFDEHQYALSKVAASDKEAFQVNFSKDQQTIGTLFFKEKIKPEVKNVIKEFKDHGFKILMLTGDQKSRAVSVAKQVGIFANDVFAEQTVESKRQFIIEQNPCLYIGDGLNDMQALSEASVSFAIKGPFESTLKISDVYAPQKDLSSVFEIIQLAKKIQNTVKANLLFALFYNIVTGACALLGFINPFVAAVLMPLSSFLITSHTVWRLR